MAIAAVFVISAGEIDLAFASIPALAGYVGAIALRAGLPWPIAVGASLMVGVCVGLINGAISVRFRVPTFIVTLGMIGVLQGMSRMITSTAAVPVMDDQFAFVFGSGDVGPVPVLLIWTIGIGALAYVGLNRTSFGKSVLAVGGNPVAARFSGINVDRVKIQVLVISGLGGALAGLLYAGKLRGVRYDIGQGDELLTVLSAVIIGGTALTGGRGSIVGAIVGSVLVGIINNGLVLLGLGTAEQLFCRGCIIVLAVALGARTSSRR
jgi:ribose transport system permease protein